MFSDFGSFGETLLHEGGEPFAGEALHFGVLEGDGVFEVRGSFECCAEFEVVFWIVCEAGAL